jgi:polyphosphate kinase
VVEFIQTAARDPKVLAIKQTLYRTSGDSPVIGALEEAVENGKQVAAIVELKARFDEENNITWARRLEEAGVHVVYGVPGLKTHSKVALVVREEAGVLRRYVHIGTGNYNPSTARVYTDFGLLTADRQLTTDIADIFNRMTGFARPTRYRGLLVAPNHMRKHLIKRIKREAKRAVAGDEAHILFKCTAITDSGIIEALYDASEAGVRIDLLVRGVCCLVPGVPGQSENIRVRSVVGRFLEHSRAYWFKNGDKPELLIGSADLMQRNLDRRVEVLAPLLDPVLQQAVRHQILEPYLSDTERTRELGSDGLYRRHRTDAETPMDVQQHFIDSKRW